MTPTTTPIPDTAPELGDPNALEESWPLVTPLMRQTLAALLHQHRYDPDGFGLTIDTLIERVGHATGQRPTPNGMYRALLTLPGALAVHTGPSWSLERHVPPRADGRSGRSAALYRLRFACPCPACAGTGVLA